MSNCVYPCPCGYDGDSLKPCTCAPAMVTKYQKRISGPLLDRIDIHVEVPRVDYEKLSGDRVSESSESIRARIPSSVMPICASGSEDIQSTHLAEALHAHLHCNKRSAAQVSQSSEDYDVIKLNLSPHFKT